MLVAMAVGVALAWELLRTRGNQPSDHFLGDSLCKIEVPSQNRLIGRRGSVAIQSPLCHHEIILVSLARISPDLASGPPAGDEKTWRWFLSVLRVETKRATHFC